MTIPHEAPSKNEIALPLAITKDAPIPKVANSNEVSTIVFVDLGKATVPNHIVVCLSANNAFRGRMLPNSFPLEDPRQSLE